MRCPDPPAHPAASGALRGPLRALGALAALAACGWVVSALAPFWAAVLLLEAVLAAAGVWAVQRLVRYGGWRKPAVERVANRVMAHAELAAPARAIEASARAGVTVNGRSVSAVVLPPPAARTATGRERRAQA